MRRAFASPIVRRRAQSAARLQWTRIGRGRCAAPLRGALCGDFQAGRGDHAADPRPQSVKGEAIVSLDPQSLIAQSWQQTSGLLIVMGVTLAALCLLVYAALARALRPTRAIKAGLERLAANDLSARLANFDLAELSAIGAVFNSLAERLQTTLAGAMS